MPEPLHIVFVCTNNVARSPMAALMFREKLLARYHADTNHKVRVSSAGTFDDPRWGTKNVGRKIAPAAAEAVAAASVHWRTADTHRAKRLTEDHLSADLIIAMDRGHVRKLEQLGVPAERIRLLRSFDPQSGTPTPDVAEPKFNYEIERVFGEINASLPGLLDWVDAQLDARRPNAGWRMWYTRPAETRLTLYSPVFNAPHPTVPDSNYRTNGPIMRAACWLPARHPAPPAPGCLCGVYGVENAVDAVFRWRHMAFNIRNLRPDSVNPHKPDKGMMPVLTEVTFHRAEHHEDIGTRQLFGIPLDLDTSTPVIRAAAVEIQRIFVPTEATDIANQLATAFAVESVAGSPDYTPHEWDTRPEWMHPTSPHAREVNRMLRGFTRNGYHGTPNAR